MFGLFDRDARRARRLRERGVPTRAVIADAQPAAAPGRWRVALLVEPAGGNSFVAHVEAGSPPGRRPARGGEAQVLHEPGRGEDVLLVAPLPVEETGEGATAPGPLAEAFGGLGPATTVTHTSVTIDGMPVEDLQSLGLSDPAALAREVLRRMGAGEAAFTNVEVSEPVELTGDAAEAMLESLAARGVLTPEQLEEIRRRRSGG